MSRYFPVLITEHLQTTVNVKADSAVEAVAKVKESWVGGGIMLNDEHFTGVEISAVENDEIHVMHRDRNGYEYMEGRKVK